MKGKESWTSYDFTMKNSQEWKQISNGDCLHFFSIWKAVEHLAKFFQHYHQDAFMLIAMQNPFRLLIFSCVLISDMIERILKKKISLISFIIYMYMYKENIFFSHRGEND